MNFVHLKKIQDRVLEIAEIALELFNFVTHTLRSLQIKFISQWALKEYLLGTVIQPSLSITDTAITKIIKNAA